MTLDLYQRLMNVGLDPASLVHPSIYAYSKGGFLKDVQVCHIETKRFLFCMNFYKDFRFSQIRQASGSYVIRY